MIHLLSNLSCIKNVSLISKKKILKLFSKMLKHLFFVDHLKGDAGSPLVVKEDNVNTLIGVASYIAGWKNMIHFKFIF